MPERPPTQVAITSTHRRIWRWLAGIALTFFLSIGVWSDHRLQELDLSNFEMRTSRCLFGIRFSKVSHKLSFAKYVTVPQAEHQWVTTSMRSWGSWYCYRYGRAVAAMETFCIAVQMADYKPTTDDVEVSANEIARLLRAGDPSGATQEAERIAIAKLP